MNQIVDKISIFIDEVKKRYVNIYIDYTYNLENDVYEIWHNREDLEYTDTEFRHLTGKLLTELFLNNNIVNVYITYDYEKAKKLTFYDVSVKFSTMNFLSCTFSTEQINYTIEDQATSRSISQSNNKTILKRDIRSLNNLINSVSNCTYFEVA